MNYNKISKTEFENWETVFSNFDRHPVEILWFLSDQYQTMDMVSLRNSYEVFIQPA